MNPTIEKFGYPETLLREYTHWVLLLRPKQATLGSMVLANKSDATRPGDLSAEAYAELSTIKRELEATLRHCFAMDKINYLMLMMVDKEVHYHVLPRYAEEKAFDGALFADPGWPKVPDMGHATELTDEQFTRLADHLKTAWIKRPENQ